MRCLALIFQVNKKVAGKWKEWLHLLGLLSLGQFLSFLSKLQRIGDLLNDLSNVRLLLCWYRSRLFLHTPQILPFQHDALGNTFRSDLSSIRLKKGSKEMGGRVDIEVERSFNSVEYAPFIGEASVDFFFSLNDSIVLATPIWHR